VKRPIGEDGDGIDIFGKDKLFKRIVCLPTAVNLHQPLAPVFPEVADRLDDTIGMLAPLKGTAKATADDAYADFAGGRVYSDGGPRGQQCAGKGKTAAFHKIAARETFRFFAVTAVGYI
jgi:hypothetical protein